MSPGGPPGRHADVLVFAEDPGAANFVADLPRALAAKGYAAHFATSGPATGYLAQRGVRAEPVGDPGALLDALAPRLVVVGTAENPDTAGLRLVALAAERRIPTLGALDSSSHLEYRFRGRGMHALAHCPDVVIVPDAPARDGLAGLGLAAGRIVVTGHPHWDHIRAVRDSLRGADREALRLRFFGAHASGRIVVLFAAELSDGMDPAQFQRSAEYSLAGSGRYAGRTEIVIEEFLAAVGGMRDRLHLALRLHPKQAAGDLADFRGWFDSVSQADSSLEVVHAADAVAGMTSMLLVEAALLGRPTCSIVPRAREAAWLPTIGAGTTPCAHKPAAVRAEAARLLELHPPSGDALERLFPPGALGRMVQACEKTTLP